MPRKIITREIIVDGQRAMYHGPEFTEEERLARHVGHKAADEMRESGKVDVACPKCGAHPEVEESQYRLRVQCPCGFIKIYEIIFWSTTPP